jgi:hypothetical protein
VAVSLPAAVATARVSRVAEKGTDVVRLTVEVASETD